MSFYGDWLQRLFDIVEFWFTQSEAWIGLLDRRIPLLGGEFPFGDILRFEFLADPLSGFFDAIAAPFTVLWLWLIEALDWLIA